MKRFARNAVLGLACALPLAAAGCVVEAHHHHYYGEVAVDVEPPAPRVEVVPEAPGVDFVWINGYWRRYHGNWEWEPGRYERRPYATARWEEHRWVKSDHGYRFEEGHWH